MIFFLDKRFSLYEILSFVIFLLVIYIIYLQNLQIIELNERLISLSENTDNILNILSEKELETIALTNTLKNLTSKNQINNLNSNLILGFVHENSSVLIYLTGTLLQLLN